MVIQILKRTLLITLKDEHTNSKHDILANMGNDIIHALYDNTICYRQSRQIRVYET